MSDPRDDPDAAQKYGWRNRNDKGYEILEQPYGFPAPRRIICIGAGATGICLAKFADGQPNLSIEVYDKNDDVAGTWTENRYPGCGCDIPSHIYQFMWSLNPSWSSYYAGASEILRYFQTVTREHGLEKYITLRHKATSASWDAKIAKWTVVVERPDGSTFLDTCDFLVNGSGVLNNWKWPDIKGLHTFTGHLAHSADWDPATELEGKRVAVFGAGSSGIQIVSNIQPSVRHLYHWIRSPLWISGGLVSGFAGPNGDNFEYTEETKRRFRSDPEMHLRYIKGLEDESNQGYQFALRNTKGQTAAVQFATQLMQQKLEKRPDIFEKIIPKTYGVGCRRPTPGHGYLESLVEPNVTIYTEDVREITPTGFIDCRGEPHEVDIIICATGFDTSFVPRIPILANGKDLRKVWESEPDCYFSVMVPSFPNYFMSLGPYGAANGSLIPTIEQTCRYILQIVQKSQVERIKSISPKLEAMHDFVEHTALWVGRNMLSEPCRSWYKGGTADGVPKIWPGSRAQFMEIFQPRYEDFEIVYENRNRYYFFGNGFARREIDGQDGTWYLGKLDGLDKQPDYSSVKYQMYALPDHPRKTGKDVDHDESLVNGTIPQPTAAI